MIRFRAGSSCGWPGLECWAWPRGRTAGAEAGAPVGVPGFTGLVPEDKRLSAEWIRGLTARGTPTVLSGQELRYVGMPIGGIGTGQLYLGGDGQLWHWDIFNYFTEGTAEKHYAQPVSPESPIAQGFSLKIEGRDWPLSSAGFRRIEFRGEYPIGTVHYRDPAAPVEVKLEAFSPFIPLALEDSSLPATTLQFTVTNTSGAAWTGMLTGELENAVLRYSKTAAGRRLNRVVTEPGFTLLECSAEPAATLRDLTDFGTMGIALLGAPPEHSSGDASAELPGQLIGKLGRQLSLAPGASTVVTFIIGWSFPNLSVTDFKRVGRHCSVRFPTAADAVRDTASGFSQLQEQTRLWRDTWYDSTLPYWFLDRTLLNVSTLATSTSLRFENGRFWGWEGVNSCAGTCIHVWGYAQAVGRLFPEIERGLRDGVDYGIGFTPEGVVGNRGELYGRPWAVDGQAMVILRTLREHQMSPDDAFLRRVWPRAKAALSALMARDVNSDGLLDGAQHNTLDSTWYGEIAWTSSLYLAAVRAGEEMARASGDTAFADRCHALAERGAAKFTAELFRDGYFINRLDPAHPEAINSGSGCHIDQVLGQSWAWQVGLGRVLPADQTRQALRTLWKYNFAPDVGPYRAAHPEGRWFAQPGEAGLLMTTFPRRDWDFARACGKGQELGFAGYFNECMNGFEYQVAGHMIWEGMVTEGMAITRAIHERYGPLKRNPWNEVECGDHYARSMASFGVFLAACGYEYNGPNGHLGFAPRITPEDFRAPFTAAEGWGTFSQQIRPEGMNAEVQVKWGSLALRTLALKPAVKPARVEATVAGRPVPAELTFNQGKTVVAFAQPLQLDSKQPLQVRLSA